MTSARADRGKASKGKTVRDCQDDIHRALKNKRSSVLSREYNTVEKRVSLWVTASAYYASLNSAPGFIAAGNERESIFGNKPGRQVHATEATHAALSLFGSTLQETSFRAFMSYMIFLRQISFRTATIQRPCSFMGDMQRMEA